MEHSGGHGNTGTGTTLVCEVAWEVCQQVGGIYTVLRSKAPTAVKRHGQHYCLIGPYNPETTPQEFEETPLRGVFGDAVKVLRAAGTRGALRLLAYHRTTARGAV